MYQVVTERAPMKPKSWAREMRNEDQTWSGEPGIELESSERVELAVLGKNCCHLYGCGLTGR